MEQTTGTLYLCATPIGNLEDITLRVLRVLQEADSIWAEDTRHTLGLLNHYEIKKPLVSCHEHNERERAQELVRALRQGKAIAFCSDAGMPGISDPGTTLLAACAAEGLPATVLPGASAVPTAAVLSGLYQEPFTFYGFLPREKKPRATLLEQLKTQQGLLLLYESPVRVPATLKELLGALGDREAALLRELTKLHEEAARGTLSSLSERFSEPPRGECVIAIQGAEPAKAADASEAELDDALARLLREGFSVRDAAAAASILLQVPKKLAYARALKLDAEQED